MPPAGRRLAARDTRPLHAPPLLAAAQATQGADVRQPQRAEQPFLYPHRLTRRHPPGHAYRRLGARSA
jgi:hypothetical protein